MKQLENSKNAQLSHLTMYVVGYAINPTPFVRRKVC